MIATLIKYTLVNKCIDVIFDRLAMVTTPLHKHITQFSKNMGYVSIELHESHHVTSLRGRDRVPFTRMDTFYHGVVTSCYDDHIEITFSRHTMIFICATVDFSTLHESIRECHEGNYKAKIFASTSQNTIHVELNDPDLALVWFDTISEVVAITGSRTTRTEFT